MSTPFRLPKLVGRKHVVASAVQEIPQFECNKLHVEKHIGRGSFGEVFLTEFRNTDKEPAEKVVVKRMLEMQDEEDTKRFIKEVRIMNELKHPNIVEFRRVCFAPCALMTECVLVSCHSEVVVTSPFSSRLLAAYQWPGLFWFWRCCHACWYRNW